MDLPIVVNKIILERENEMPIYPTRVDIVDIENTTTMVVVVDKKYMDCIRRIVRKKCVQEVGEEKANECVKLMLKEFEAVNIRVRGDVADIEIRNEKGSHAGFIVRFKAILWNKEPVVCEEEDEENGTNYI